MKHNDPVWRRRASLFCTIALTLAVPAQMHVNKEWAETTGAPDNLDGRQACSMRKAM